MYLEKLTDEEIKDLFVKLGGVFAENPSWGEYHFSIGRIEKTKGGLTLKFTINRDEHYLNVSDYDCESSIRSCNSPAKAKLYLRKFMYQKFGNSYYEDMRDYYKRIILSKCDKQLEKLSNELNEMIK